MEDDEEANNMDYDDDGSVPRDDLGVIKEEEDEQDGDINNPRGSSKSPVKKSLKPPVAPLK
jgi:hypothetical protein